MSDEERDKSPSRESSEGRAHSQLMYFSITMVKTLLYTLIHNSVEMMLMFAMEGHMHLQCDGVCYKTARDRAGVSSRVQCVHEWIEQQRWNSRSRRDISRAVIDCVMRAVMPRLERLAEQMAELPLTTDAIHLIATIVRVFTRCPLPAMPPSQSSASSSASSPPPPPPPSPVNSPRGAVRKQPESRSFRRLNSPGIDSFFIQAFTSATDPASRCSRSRGEIFQIGVEVAKLHLKEIIIRTQITQRLCGHTRTPLANLFAESRTPAQPPSSPFPRPPSAAIQPPMSHPHPAARNLLLSHPPPLTAKMSFPRPTPPTARDQPFSFQPSSIAQRLPTSCPLCPNARKLPTSRPLSPNARKLPTSRPLSPNARKLSTSRPLSPNARKLPTSRPLSPNARKLSTSRPLSPNARKLPTSRPLSPNARKLPTSRPLSPNARKLSTSRPLSPNARKLPTSRPLSPNARKLPTSRPLSPNARKLPTSRQQSPNARRPTSRPPSPNAKSLPALRPPSSRKQQTLHTPPPNVRRRLASRSQRRAPRRPRLSRPLSPVASGMSISSSLSPISNLAKNFESPSESSFEQRKHNLDCQLAQIFNSCKKDKCCENKNCKKWNDLPQIEDVILELISALSTPRSSSPDSVPSDSSTDSNNTWPYYRDSYRNCQRFKPDALTAAAWAGQLDEVRALLGCGIHVDAVDSYGRTALRVASSAGHVDVVRFLLERGAQVDSRPQGNKNFKRM